MLVPFAARPLPKEAASLGFLWGPVSAAPPIGCTPQGTHPAPFFVLAHRFGTPFSVGAHSVRPPVNVAVIRRGGYHPPAVHHPRYMLHFSGADYLAEAPEQVIEENGSDNV